MKKLLLFSLAVLLTAMIGSAQAANIAGHTVNVTHYFPDLATVNSNMGNQVVPTGIFDYSNIYDYQVFADHLTWNVFCGTGCSWVPSSFNGPVLTDLTAGIFTGAWIDASSNYPGFTASRLTWDASHIYINGEGLDANGYLRVNFTNAVPEPATVSLIGLSMLGLGFVRRRNAR